MLNWDLKLFTKILSMRLGAVLQRIIPLNQVGFIRIREARDNTIRTIDVITRVRHLNTSFIFLSTDAEKAFNKVDWTFPLATLRHIGMPVPNESWISAFYSTPTATVKVNGVASNSFTIGNGTRQGCPLSTLLFKLSLEPLLQHR